MLRRSTVLFTLFVTLSASLHSAVPVMVETTPAVKNPFRIGLNFATSRNSGPAHMTKNILLNSSFEPYIDRILVIVEKTGTDRFFDSQWRRYDNDYWNGATYDIRTGPSAGKRGTIDYSLRSGEGDLPEYHVKGGSLPTLSKGDVLVLTKNHTDKFKGQNTSSSTETHPNSLGERSMEMKPKGTKFADRAEYKLYFDSPKTTRPRKFLSVDGKWALRFWAKATEPNMTLQARMKRLGGTPFFDRDLNLTKEWKQYTIDFSGKDEGPTRSIEVLLTVLSDKGSVLVDDLEFFEADEPHPDFRQIAVDGLKTLRPSFLRTDQTPGTLENWLVGPHERKPVSVRVNMGRKSHYVYALPEFLDLCEEVGANPWIIFPTVYSDKECEDFGIYLARVAPKSRFSEVIIEFGNENWNRLFGPMGLQSADLVGKVANRDFKLVTKGNKNRSHLRKVIGGHFSNAVKTVMRVLENTSEADTLALAPYFFKTMDQGTTPLQGIKQAFGESFDHLNEYADAVKDHSKEIGAAKDLAIYEVNFSPLRGTAPATDRSAVVASAASGGILAKKLLNYMSIGVNPSLVFTYSQFAYGISQPDKGWVKIWGVTRDFGPPIVYRPTGLAITMLNRVIGGDLYKMIPLGGDLNKYNQLTLAAFKAPEEWTAAIVNESDQPQEVEILFPDDGHPLPSKLSLLSSKTPFDTNEEKENVHIVEKTLYFNKQVVTVTVPAFGLVTLGETQASTPPPKEPPEEPPVILPPEPKPEPPPEPKPEPPPEPKPEPPPEPKPEPPPEPKPEPPPEPKPEPPPEPKPEPPPEPKPEPPPEPKPEPPPAPKPEPPPVIQPWNMTKGELNRALQDLLKEQEELKKNYQRRRQEYLKGLSSIRKKQQEIRRHLNKFETPSKPTPVKVAPRTRRSNDDDDDN